MPRLSLLTPFKALGPGLVLAAAGIGAGDVVTATVIGAKFGTRLAWALLACVILKWVLNEGMARWQLATGSTMIEASMKRLPRWVSLYFFLYLLLWTFFVSASLASACGLAGHSLFPQLPIWAWGIIHSIMAAALVWGGKFDLFERVMKILVGIMVLTVLTCAILLKPDGLALLRDLFLPSMPAGSGKSVLSIFGGIGGSMTMLCYDYWMRENAWIGPKHQRVVRWDLLLAYGVTVVFAIALTIVAAGCNAVVTQGNGMALEVASRLEGALGPVGHWAFLIGFWCAVFASMLGVWQGVPYFFADFMAHRRGAKQPPVEVTQYKNTAAYRGYLLYLAGPPMVLLFADKPVSMVLLFTVIGAFFMPLLAALLLYVNNRKDWIGEMRNGWLSNIALVISLVMFGWIAVTEIVGAFAK
ncbi:MAG: Nramp family divalent metal transporter [Verrucomicrobiota bacterium]